MDKDRKFNPKVADKARELIGQFFKKRREELGLSQRDLAKCAGMIQAQVNNFEAGKQNVTINTLLAMAGCLRLKIFFEDADPNTPAGFEKIPDN